MNNKCIFFENNFKDFFQEIYTSRIINKEGNPLITLLITLYLTISFFCVFTYLEIVNFKNSDFLLLDNFIKRYKSFVDGAIYINNNLENLNVLINLLYEKFLNGSKSLQPKFSIYRLMIILYNRIVINPLSENIIKSTSNIYDIYLKEELRKIDNENQINYSLSSTKDNSYEDLVNNLNNLNDDNTCENVDYQINQFLENIPLIFVDSICDEYSVFYINSTYFPIYGNYKKLQDSFLKITVNNFNKFNLICNYKFIDLVKENEYFNEKLINVTKINIYQCIYKQIIKESFIELKNSLDDINNDNRIINFLKDNKRDFYKCKYYFFL